MTKDELGPSEAFALAVCSPFKYGTAFHRIQSLFGRNTGYAP